MKPPSSRNARQLPIRWQAYAMAALLFVAILFGGGGAEGPINNGVIHAASAVLLGLLFASAYSGSWPLARPAAAVTWLLVALLVIVALQLVPLPPSIWQSLPERELARNALALVGAADEWRPLTLDPDGTRRFAATLLLPAAVLYFMLGATRREILLVLRSIVFAAIISGILGALQLALSIPSWLAFYDGPTPGTASGVFANQNHQATMMVSAILFVAVLIRAGRSRRPSASRSQFAGFLHPAWLALPFFIAIILFTGSRTGIILLAIALPAALVIGLGGRSPLLWLGGLAAIVLAGAVLMLFSPSGNSLAVGRSFILSEDLRYAFLPDVLYTLRQYWPWGSGLGTFVPVFAPNENLDVAGAGFVNHAHNDLLEWLIETGIIGTIWLAVAVGLLLWRLVTVARTRAQLRGSQFAAIMAGALILLLIGIHSLLDFPIRMAAISAVAAIAAGLVLTPLVDAPPRPLSSRGARWPYIAGALAGIAVGALAMRVFALEAAVRADRGSAALAIRSDSGRALALAAEEQLEMRNREGAMRLASAAIERTPLNSAAVRVLAMALDPAAAVEPWRVASAMGWRDAPTQLWALQQALANGEHEVAAVRADAFLRTRGRLEEEYLTVVRVASMAPGFRTALAARLELRPAWRERFFSPPVDASAQEVTGTAAMLRHLAATGRTPTLGEARSTISRLIEGKRHAEALEIYRQIRGGRGDQLLDDGGFDRPVEDYRDNSTAFDWLLRPMSSGTATIDEGDGRYLFLQSDGNAARPLLQRYVAVAPGSYRLIYMRRGEAESPDAIGIRIRCADGRQIGASSEEPLQSSEFERREIRFNVDQNCPMISLLFLGEAVGRPASAEFDDFSLGRTS